MELTTNRSRRRELARRRSAVWCTSPSRRWESLRPGPRRRRRRRWSWCHRWPASQWMLSPYLRVKPNLETEQYWHLLDEHLVTIPLAIPGNRSSITALPWHLHCFSISEQNQNTRLPGVIALPCLVFSGRSSTMFTSCQRGGPHESPKPKTRSDYRSECLLPCRGTWLRIHEQKNWKFRFFLM